VIEKLKKGLPTPIDRPLIHLPTERNRSANSALAI
jgi:hypothetical protein